MRPMTYIEEEKFLDTLVVDSEGYICGRVASFEIEPDRVLMKLYREEEEEIEVVDIERLKEELMLHVFGKVGPKFEKKLYDKIRKALKMPSKAPVGEAELVSFARALGVEIPMKKVVKKVRKEVEEPVDLEIVERVSETPLGKCIILKEPWEAKRRGLPILDFVPYRSTAEVKGMLVIDAEGKIIGHAERILIGKPLGLRIAVETVREEEVVDFPALYEALLSYFKTPRRLYERVARDLGIGPEQVNEKQIITWAERMGVAMPKRKERKIVKQTTLDIPWTVIKKIGDVIMLKKTLEELRARGVPLALAEEAKEAVVSEPKPLDLSEEVHEDRH
ncbi:hypothetical protein DRO33_01680 [Candidatus Bathyarchaeota archaeon]|nr:MAG: hypothetical protein DRO33_01680 [Candidatus Bathyarchaeota archaeon]